MSERVVDYFIQLFHLSFTSMVCIEKLYFVSFSHLCATERQFTRLIYGLFIHRLQEQQVHAPGS